MQQDHQEKIEIGSEIGKKFDCSVCQKEGTSSEVVQLHTGKGQSIVFCKECKDNANKSFEEETVNPKIFLAILFGIIGGIIGGIVWYYFTITTNIELGYISLGLGYLVGFGVYFGAGKKRGQKLQIISAIIALIAIIVTERYIFQHFVNEYLKNNLSEFPDYTGQVISVPFYDSEFWSSIASSPMGLFIYAIGIYLAFNFCKPRKI